MRCTLKMKSIALSLQFSSIYDCICFITLSKFCHWENCHSPIFMNDGNGRDWRSSSSRIPINNNKHNSNDNQLHQIHKHFKIDERKNTRMHAFICACLKLEKEIVCWKRRRNCSKRKKNVNKNTQQQRQLQTEMNGRCYNFLVVWLGHNVQVQYQ